MRKRTTTGQLQQAITNNLLHIEKVEIYHKSTHKTDKISIDSFKDSLDFICETIFAPCIGQYFEKDFKTGDYEIDCSRMNGSSDIVIIAHLCANEGVSEEDIESILKIEEE